MVIWNHALLAFAVYQPNRKLNWMRAVFWAVFPDLIWGFPFGIYLLITGIPYPHSYFEAPFWLYLLYASGHSFVTSYLSIAVVYLIWKKFPFEMLAWPFLHVLIDIPGHTSFTTPFLFPLSMFSIKGPFSWTDPFWNIFSYAAPVTILGFFYLKRVLKGDH